MDPVFQLDSNPAYNNHINKIESQTSTTEYDYIRNV